MRRNSIVSHPVQSVLNLAYDLVEGDRILVDAKKAILSFSCTSPGHSESLWHDPCPFRRSSLEVLGRSSWIPRLDRKNLPTCYESNIVHLQRPSFAVKVCDERLRSTQSCWSLAMNQHHPEKLHRFASSQKRPQSLVRSCWRQTNPRRRKKCYTFLFLHQSRALSMSLTRSLRFSPFFFGGTWSIVLNCPLNRKNLPSCCESKIVQPKRSSFALKVLDGIVESI
jgi:hypothetical protein